jgi:hypothetical protein
MTKDEELRRLKEQLLSCRSDSELLRKELDFLKTFPTLAQGIKGETLVAQLAGGVITGYAESHDVTVHNGARLEVKYSHLNRPGRSKTRRWGWSSLLGKQNRKEYDFLVLIGEKDPRYEAQYPGDLPYVFFLVPRGEVKKIRNPAIVALNTNLETANAQESEDLKRHLVVSGATFQTLLENLRPNKALEPSAPSVSNVSAAAQR